MAASLHNVVLIGAGIAFFHDVLSPLNVVGFVVCQVGVFFYVLLRRNGAATFGIQTWGLNLHLFVRQCSLDLPLTLHQRLSISAPQSAPASLDPSLNLTSPPSIIRP